MAVLTSSGWGQQMLWPSASTGRSAGGRASGSSSSSPASKTTRMAGSSHASALRRSAGPRRRGPARRSPRARHHPAPAHRVQHRGGLVQQLRAAITEYGQPDRRLACRWRRRRGRTDLPIWCSIWASASATVAARAPAGGAGQPAGRRRCRWRPRGPISSQAVVADAQGDELLAAPGSTSPVTTGDDHGVAGDRPGRVPSSHAPPSPVTPPPPPPARAPPRAPRQKTTPDHLVKKPPQPPPPPPPAPTTRAAGRAGPGRPSPQQPTPEPPPLSRTSRPNPRPRATRPPPRSPAGQARAQPPPHDHNGTRQAPPPHARHHDGATKPKVETKNPGFAAEKFGRRKIRESAKAIRVQASLRRASSSINSDRSCAAPSHRDIPEEISFARL